MQLNPNTTLQNGKYRIIRVLGQGGFGITYLAEHTLLKNKVAIKEFFPKTYCDRDENTSRLTIGTRSNQELVNKLKRRFVKEAVNLATFNHPGIVKVIDVFEENNTSYFIMDFIEGESLSEKVKRTGKLAEDDAVNHIYEVGEALSHIHSHNITHFDVKPANIMVRSFDGKPVLIDFGLSVQYTEEGDETSTNIGAASPGYAPLEMYDVTKLQSFSPSTDVYSLGATLYFLLTGEVPPTATDIISEGLDIPNYINGKIFQVIERSMLTRKKRTPTVKAFLDELREACNPDEVKIQEDGKTELINPQTHKTIESVPQKPIEETIAIPKISKNYNLRTESQIKPPPFHQDLEVENKFVDKIKFIDLGLSVKWADCNVDAKYENEAGSYFSNIKKLHFYNYYNKNIDIPTEAQVNELILKCKWEWVNKDNFCGFKITGPNGNHIFLTSTGLTLNSKSNLYGCYWTREAFYNQSNWFLYISKYQFMLTKYALRMNIPIRLIAE